MIYDKIADDNTDDNINLPQRHALAPELKEVQY